MLAIARLSIFSLFILFIKGGIIIGIKAICIGIMFCDAIAIIAGMAYRASSLPKESVPNDTVLLCADIYFIYPFYSLVNVATATMLLS